MRLITLFSALALVCAASGLTGMAEASERNELARTDDDVLVYRPDFFSDFNPQTALDLVGRVPGFSINGGGGARGLSGTLGNVLINGRRPSSKNGVGTLLSRLPASAVEQIELIRSPLPGIDMAGQDQVVNVILTGDGSWSGTWRGRLSAFESGRITPNGNVSMTRTQGLSSLTLAVSLDTAARGNDLERSVFLSDESFLESEVERNQNNFHDVTPSLAWTREFEAGHALRLDSRVWSFGFSSNRTASSFDTDAAIIGFEAGRNNNEGWGTESTLDYNHSISGAWSAKLTGLQRYTSEDRLDALNFFDGDGAIQERVEISNDETAGESVLRSEVRFAPSEDRSWTLSLEGAFNFLDRDLIIQSDTGAGLMRVDVPVSDVRVEERRADIGLQHVWRVSETLTLDSTIGVEFSEISQTGDAEQSRQLSYFKPALQGIWTPNEFDQVRLTMTRAVDQLSFGQFVSSVNIVDDVTNVGNPDLEPQRTWRLQADWERRFWDEGTLTLLVRHEWVEGVSDIVPFATTGTEGPGNLGNGQRLRLQANLELPTDRLGVPGGLLSLSGMTRETRVTDPVTGVERRFRGDEDWRFRVDFRQDLPQLGFAWGFDYYLQGDEDFYRLARFERTRAPRGDLDVFVEKRMALGLTARIGADLRLGTNDRERFDWPTSRADGFPTQIERRTFDQDATAFFEITGVF